MKAKQTRLYWVYVDPLTGDYGKYLTLGLAAFDDEESGRAAEHLVDPQHRMVGHYITEQELEDLAFAKFEGRWIRIKGVLPR